MPALLIGVLLLLVTATASGKEKVHRAAAKVGLPTDLFERIKAATEANNAAALRALADELHATYPAIADELRKGADILDQADSVENIPEPTPVEAPPPGAVPVEAVPAPVLSAPKGSVPVSPPAPSVEVPSPEAGEMVPGGSLIPDPSSQAGRVALMLYESAPKGPVKDVALLGAWKRSVGVVGAPELYGPGTAQSLYARGIVPPTPWDWPSPERAAKSKYRAELEYLSRQDSARSEEWLQAAAKVV